MSQGYASGSMIIPPDNGGTPSTLLQQRGSLLVAQGARISDTLGRVRTVVRTVGATASTTLYTPPSGKRYMVVSVQGSLTNTAASTIGRLRLRDGGDAGLIQSSVAIDAQGTALGATAKAETFDLEFTEPIRFITDVRLNVVSGTLSIDIVMTGYLEDNI